MIEVESKIFLRNPNETREKARVIGKYLGIELKIDDYFTREKINRYPKESIRVRKVNGFYVTNFKKRLSYKNGVYAKQEIEHLTKDIKNLMRVMSVLGFRKWLRKEKKCEIYKIKKHFQIEINYVKNLGWFAEIEYLVKNISQINSARQEVRKIIKKLGFSEKDAIKSGYTKMLWNKKLRKN